jgi:LPXTG-motif cell wall-anchored protein
MKLTTRSLSRLLLAAAVCAMFTVVMAAQDRTTTTTQAGAPTTATQVERGTVTYVSGNDLIVKMESGVVRYFNVPDTARVTVDGKELNVHQLKAGMKLQRTITTTETPKTVTTVRTIQGKVVQVIAPLTVILSFPEGPNKEYKIPADQKFIVNDKELTVFDLRPGMVIGATAVSTSQEVSVSEQRRATGTGAPPPIVEPRPTTPTMQGALLIEVPAPAAPAPPRTAAAPARAAAPAPPAPEPAPVKLPKTGSELPWIGLLGLLSCAGSFGLRMLRRA